MSAAVKHRWKLDRDGVPEGQERTSTRHYPTGPVEAFLRARLGPTVVMPDGDSSGYTIARAAACLGIEANSYARVVKRGTITEPAADRWATRLGLHPADLWPQWWDLWGAA